ncbi:MAG: Glutamine amidotransferase, class I [uncultured Solirubrobacteraceae bacterium]|uniref:Glutamine amidotransferase, class I n=1 Tax=uncultured Solirubrobacteraceae bacterium TaxID=1162706 RepID=A0A6J4RV47_9ACTN|nr:MAG: Glutamine amidotransferase, class I [uncultured Solirubrobacteraceae bacterium]
MSAATASGESARRPRIGICASVEQARYGVWDSEVLLVPQLYVSAVQRAGGLALLLAPDPVTVRDPDELLDQLDGLVLAGGVDMDPLSYGAERHPTVTRTVPERDAFEMALARRALERDVPLLGICRGMQVLNVACGGTLIQHLPDDVGHEDHRRSPGSFDDADHDVRLEAGSIAARAAGETLHGTLSHHHQGVDRIGSGLRVTGWATLDDLPEAIEAPESSFALGVQWHPEADPSSTVVAALVAEAQRRIALAPA